MFNTVTLPPVQQYLVCATGKLTFEGKFWRKLVTPEIERSRFSGKNDLGDRQQSKPLCRLNQPSAFCLLSLGTIYQTHINFWVFFLQGEEQL